MESLVEVICLGLPLIQDQFRNAVLFTQKKGNRMLSLWNSFEQLHIIKVFTEREQKTLY